MVRRTIHLSTEALIFVCSVLSSVLIFVFRSSSTGLIIERIYGRTADKAGDETLTIIC